MIQSNKIILIIMSLLLCSSFVFSEELNGYENSKFEIKEDRFVESSEKVNNGKVRDIKNKVALNKVKSIRDNITYKNSKEISQPSGTKGKLNKKELSEKSVNSKVKKEDIKEISKINKIKDHKNNKNIIYSGHGSLSRKNINDNVKVQFGERLIKVTNYNKSTDKFEVILYTGTDGVMYDIYRHNDSTDPQIIKENGTYLKSVESVKGYIEYTTDSFSSQYASIPDQSLVGNDIITMDLTDYFLNFDYIDYIVSSKDTSDSQSGCVGLCGSASDTFNVDDTSFEVFAQSISGGDREFVITGNDFDNSFDVVLTVSEDGTAGTAESDNFDVFTSASASAPTQLASIPNINIDGTESEGRGLNSIFTDFSDVTLTFPADSATRVLTIDDSSNYNDIYSGNEIFVELDYNFISDTFTIYVDGENEDYNDDFDVEVSNSAGSASTTFNVVTNSETNPPNQYSSISDVNIVGTSSQSLSLSSFFNNYDDVSISFDGSTSSQTLSTSKGGVTDSYSDSSIEVNLIPSSTNVVTEIVGKDEDFTSSMTITVSNNDGSVDDTISINLNEDTSSGGGGSGSVDLTELESATELYYSMDDDDISGSTISDLTPNGNDGTINGATTGATGILNEALSFDGSNDYIDSPYITFEDSEIVSFWLETTETDYSMIQQEINGEPKRIYLRSNGDLQILYGGSSSSRIAADATSANANDGNLNHFLILVDDTATGDDRLRVFKNKNELSINFNNNNPIGTMTGTDMSIMGDFTNNQRYLDGILDELIILDSSWTSAGTVEDLAEYYYNQDAPTEDEQYPYSSGSVSNPTTQIASIADISIDGTDSFTLPFDNHFSNYDDISLSFQASSSTQSLSTSVGGTTDSYSDSDIDVSLVLSSNNINLEVTGLNNEYSEEFSVTASNTDGSVSDTFDVTINEESDPPTQIASIPPAEINGNDIELYSFSDYFTNYDDIMVTIPDNNANNVIQTSLSGFSQEVYSGTIEVRITELSNVRSLAIEGFNEVYNDSITLTVSNDDGSISTEIPVVVNFVENETSGGGNVTNGDFDYPSWIPEPEDSQKPFWALIIIIGVVAFISISNKNDSMFSTMTFGTTASVGLFLIFSYIGWIPIWITVVLIMILAIVGAKMLSQSIRGD